LSDAVVEKVLYEFGPSLYDWRDVASLIFTYWDLRRTAGDQNCRARMLEGKHGDVVNNSRSVVDHNVILSVANRTDRLVNHVTDI